jgi:hypothetical protein
MIVIIYSIMPGTKILEHWERRTFPEIDATTSVLMQ